MKIKLNETMLGVFSKFQKNPFRYLYEADLQSELYAQLSEVDSAEIVLKTNDDFKKRFLNVDEIKTTAWKAEYPSGIRYDLAAIDTESCGPDHLPWNQPVSTAIEIKYLQCGESERKFKEKYLDDVRKLTAGIENKQITSKGIAMLFIQYEITNLENYLQIPYRKFTGELGDGITGIVITPKDVFTATY